MQLREMPASDYEALFPEGCVGAHLYNSVPFTELMRGAGRGVRYLAAVAPDGTPLAALPVGEGSQGRLRSPFSAPFGGWRWRRMPAVDEARSVAALLAGRLDLTLPPQVYDPALHAVLAEALEGARLAYTDINHHYPLRQADDPAAHMNRKARNKWRQALRHPFRLVAGVEAARAYAVISANRQAKGYPLRMTLEQVERTVAVASTRFYVLALDGEGDVAAAQVQESAEGIAQVVYWGDAPGYSQLRPMNLLPPLLFTHYRALGRRVLDIGPSSSAGEVSAGLSDYKESLGCLPTPKPTYAL